MPLAIELAAAKLRALTLEQLSARLSDRFRLLTGGMRTNLPRQQTLQALVTWSYDLLDEQERLLFERLAVFAGGWTLEAAEAVCAGEGIPSADVLDLLTNLIDKSLVIGDVLPDGSLRYRFLETLRQYAEQRFQARGEPGSVRLQHAQYFLRAVEGAAPELQGATQQQWLGKMAEEYDNIRAALETLTSSGETVAALRLVGGLWRFWEVRGHWTEGRVLLANALSAAGGGEPFAPRAKALQGAGILAFYQGDYGPADEQLQESLAVFRQLSDRTGILWSSIYLGWMANDRGDPAAARVLLAESLALARDLGDWRGISWAMARLGLVAMFAGDYQAAEPALTEALELARRLSDQWGTAWCLHLLAVVWVWREDANLALAEALEQESIAIWKELSDRRNLAYSHLALGGALLAGGDVVAARQQLSLALPIFVEISDPFGLIGALAVWVCQLVEERQSGQALHLAGVLGTLTPGGIAGLPLPFRLRVEPACARATQAMGAEAA